MINHQARCFIQTGWLVQTREPVQSDVWRRLALLPLALAFVIVGIAVGGTTAQAAPDDFDQLLVAELSGAAETTPNDSSATGYAVFAISEGNGITHTVHYRLSVADIENVTAAHVHIGLPGVDGPILVDLLNGASLLPAGPVSGQFTMTVDDILELSAGDMYVNVHTAAFPDGEIRGQVEVMDVPAARHALLLGYKERPDPVETAARGMAQLDISSSGMVTYVVEVADIENVTAAHIHRGTPEEAGPVVFDLNGAALSPSTPLSGTLQFGTGDMVDLVTGHFYVNVHTEEYPAGEIRGEIVNASLFEADLTGAEEVPPVATSATGRAVLGLDAQGTNLAYRVSVNNIEDIIGAHIHLGARGENGGIVVDLFPSGTFTEDEPLSGSAMLSTSDVLDMIGDLYYINVHTDAYPNGEIRGQVMPMLPQTRFEVSLTADNEQAESSGEADLRFDPLTGLLHYTVRVMNLPNIEEAHIHRGLRGEDGPIVFDLYDGEGPFDAENPISGAVQLESDDMVDLLTGNFYINVHTTEQPAGAIRGQIEAEGQVMPEINLFVPQLDRGGVE